MNDPLHLRVADEIDRLRAERDQWRRGSAIANGQLLDEIDRLRAELARVTAERDALRAYAQSMSDMEPGPHDLGCVCMSCEARAALSARSTK